MSDVLDRSLIISDETILTLPIITPKTKIIILLISAFENTARMIGRMFTELYAVIIGSSATALSLITSIRNLIQLALQSSFGRISDFLGRKILILFGLFGAGISLAMFPFIHNQWVLVVGVFIYASCFACYNPSYTALIGDLTKKENRAGLFSLLTLGGSLLSFLGLLAVGELSSLAKIHFTQYSHFHLQTFREVIMSYTKFKIGVESTYLSRLGHDQYSIILYITAFLFIITGFISVLLTNPPTEKITKKTVLTFKPLKENKRFRTFVIIGSIMGFSMALGWPIFPFIRSNFATAQENTWIWSAYSISMLITLLIIRPHVDKIKRKWTLFIGRIFMFFIPLNLAIAALYIPKWWFMAIGAGVSGFSSGFYMVAESSYALDCAPTKEKGTYTGLFYMFMGITTFLGSLISGVLADLTENYLGELRTIILFLWIITAARFLAAFGFLFLKEPMDSKNG